MIAAESLSPRTEGRRGPDSVEPWEQVRAFYRSRAVRDRILEYYHRYYLPPHTVVSVAP